MGPTDEEARELLLRSWTLGMSTGDVDDCIALIQGSIRVGVIARVGALVKKHLRPTKAEAI